MSNSPKSSRKSSSRKTKAQLEQELAKAKAELKSLKTKVTDTSRQGPASTEAADPARKQEMAVAKASFRIDLYDPGEGALQGKIEYLLTKSKKAFQGLDEAAIISFIQAHLPVAADEKKTKPRKAKGKVTQKELPRIVSVETFAAIDSEPNFMVSHEEQFQVKLNLEQTDSTHLPLHVLLYARPLGRSQSRKMVGGTTEVLKPDSSSIAIAVAAHALEPGTYRLEAALNSSDGQSQQAFAAQEESELIYVY